MTHVSVDMRQRMQLIGVTELLGTKNSSSSRAEKWALTSMRTECEKCRKMRQNGPPQIIPTSSWNKPTSRFKRVRNVHKASLTDAEHTSTVKPESVEHGNHSWNHLPGISAILYSTSEHRASDCQTHRGTERVLER